MKFKKLGLSALAITAFAGALALSSCGNTTKDTTTGTTTAVTTTTTGTTTAADTTTTVADTVLSYSEYIAAEDGSTVTISGAITGRCTFDSTKNAASFYLQDNDGAYYIYNLPCTEDAYTNDLVVGKNIKVTGYKGSWSGEVEILGLQAGEEATYELLDGTSTYEAKTVTLAELVNYPNQKVKLENLTVVEQTNATGDKGACFYNWDNSGTSAVGTDLYYTVTDGTTTYQFVVEAWLENTQYGSETYTKVEGLNVGDNITIEGFAYTYNDPQVQTTSISINK